MTARRVLWFTVLLVLGIGLAACGPSTGTAAAGTGHRVPATCGRNATIRLPVRTTGPEVSLAGLRVAWVLRCSTDARVAPGGGMVVRTERADSPTDGLMAALRQRSQPPPPNVLCADVFVPPPYFALVGADGVAVMPTIPTSGCGPNPEVLRALAALPFRTIAMTSIPTAAGGGDTAGEPPHR